MRVWHASQLLLEDLGCCYLKGYYSPVLAFIMTSSLVRIIMVFPWLSIESFGNKYYHMLFHTLSPQGNTDHGEPPYLKDYLYFKVENWIEYYQLLPHILGYFYTLDYLLDYSNNLLSYTAQSWRQIDCIITVLRRLWHKTTGHIQLPKNAVQCITCFK